MIKFSRFICYVLIAAFVLPLFFVATASRGSAWIGSGWNRRRPVTITAGDNGMLENYAVEIIVTYDSDMQADFDDLRFTDENDVELSYLVENYNASENATVWVKVPFPLGASVSENILMYYGDASAESAENGDAVFLLFDDMQSEQLGDWTRNGGTWTWQVDNYRLVGSAGRSHAYQDFPDNENYAYSVRIRRSLGAGGEAGVLFYTDSFSADSGNAYNFRLDGAIAQLFRITGESWSQLGGNVAHAYVTGTWYDFEVRVRTLSGGTHILCYIDDSLIFDELDTDGGRYTAGKVGVRFGATSTFGFDEVMVRIYVAPEPTTSVGDEESYTPPNAAPNAPTNLLPSTRQTSTSVILTASVTDNDGNVMNVHFYDNSDNSLIDNTWAENGTTAQVVWSGLTRGDTFSFFAGCHDNNDEWGENSDVQTFNVEGIYIDGDSSFCVENGVNGGGDGSAGDPYILENWVVDALGGHGIVITNTTSYFVVRNCLVENGGVTYRGILLDNIVNGRVENNIVNGNNDGILLSVSDNNTIINNVCQDDGSYGITLDDSDNNTVSGNVCGDSEAGIGLDGSDNNTVTGNTCENNDYGFYITGSSSNNLENNICSFNADWGIHVRSSSVYNVLDNNTCENNDYGIEINNSDNNTLIYNTCENNTTYGIVLISSDNNLIFYNYLLTNTDNNASDDGTNDWDNDGVGNWWSDWQPPIHPDTDGDGIAQDARPILGGSNQDDYPRVPAYLYYVPTLLYRVVLSWTENIASENYDIQIDDDSDFSSLVIQDNNLENNYYTYDLAENDTYYWRVRVISATGIVGPWSAAQTIRVNIAPSVYDVTIGVIAVGLALVAVALAAKRARKSLVHRYDKS